MTTTPPLEATNESQSSLPIILPRSLVELRPPLQHLVRRERGLILDSPFSSHPLSKRLARLELRPLLQLPSWLSSRKDITIVYAQC